MGILIKTHDTILVRKLYSIGAASGNRTRTIRSEA